MAARRNPRSSSRALEASPTPDGAVARPPRRTRLGAAFVLAALVLGGAGAGCASILGFEDTTLRSGGNEEGGTPVDDGGLPPADGDVPVDAGAARLTATPKALVLRRGGTVDLSVVLARGASITGTVTARLAKLPTGVTATTATLPTPQTTTTLTLSASASATLGPAKITLTADGTTLPPVALALTVAESAGAPDVSFNGGFVSDATKGVAETYYALAVQPDGLILAGGGGAAGATGASAGWIVRRYDASGVADAAFTNAVAAGPGSLPTEGQVQAMALDGKGNIVCVGASTQPIPALTIARLLPSGSLDVTFGGGVVRLPVTDGPAGSTGLGLALQADGSVIVVGSRRDALTTEAGIIARFKSNGTRDVAFNGGATVVIPATRLVGASLEASGAVLVAGSTISGALPSFFLTRRTSLGAIDSTFGAAGTASFGNTYRANAFARLADDSLALVGDVQLDAGAYTAGVANAKGDPVFARAFATPPSAGFYGLAVQSDTRLIAAGHTSPGVNGEARVERFFQDGGKDLSFSDGGAAILEPAGLSNALEVTLFAAAVQSDGRILVAGNRSTTGAVIYRLWP
jgi:uncharacterized delta-60 repeat protein